MSNRRPGPKPEKSSPEKPPDARRQRARPRFGEGGQDAESLRAAMLRVLKRRRRRSA